MRFFDRPETLFSGLGLLVLVLLVAGARWFFGARARRRRLAQRTGRTDGWLAIRDLNSTAGGRISLDLLVRHSDRPDFEEIGKRVDLIELIGRSRPDNEIPPHLATAVPQEQQMAECALRQLIRGTLLRFRKFSLDITPQTRVRSEVLEAEQQYLGALPASLVRLLEAYVTRAKRFGRTQCLECGDWNSWPSAVLKEAHEIEYRCNPRGPYTARTGRTVRYRSIDCHTCGRNQLPTGLGLVEVDD